MGCLSVKSTRCNSKITCGVTGMGGVGIHNQCMNTPVVLNVSGKNLRVTCSVSYMGVVAVGVAGKNTPVSIAVKPKNARFSVNVALVCHVGYGKYELLYVSEGALIISEGYLMVERTREAH